MYNGAQPSPSRFYVKSEALNPQLEPDRQYRLDIMDICVSYEYSHASDPRAYIATVPKQLVTGVPPNIPRALLPEYIAAVILQ
ncbi:hypothetical protein [Paraburkholderia aromaticivorans]|uniref:hypothetical protein n=1 Tax=Paraburkholderia aromaticivorans TaxID=2026199 RepID=UPI0014560285|nr:hypothetical protein [Paraburkholderia aromaticivorans]